MAEVNENADFTGEQGKLEMGEIPLSLDTHPESTTSTLKEDLPSVNEKVTYPDGGYGWVIVFASFLVCFFVWGQAFSYGVYLEEYSTVVFPNAGVSDLSFIGSVSTGLIGLLGLVSGRFCDRFGHRTIVMVGGSIGSAGLILSSFATEIWHLYLTQSILFAIGGSLTFTAAISLPSQWFYKHRGLATGIAVSGSGIGGLAIAPVVRLIINKLGWHWSLRIMGILSFVFLNLAGALSRTRLPPPKRGNLIDLGPFVDPRFLALFFTGGLTYFAFLIPYFLISEYMVYIGGTVEQGALIVGLMNGAGAIGRMLMGLLADKFGRINLLFLANFFAGLAVLVIWTQSNSFAVLVVFSLVFGFFSGGFISLSPVVTAQIFGVERLATIYGLVSLSSGIPGILGTPIATWIVQQRPPQQDYVGAAIYTGALLIGASACTAWLKFLTSTSEPGKGFWSRR